MNLADIQKRVLASSSKKYLLDEYPNAAAAYSLRKLRSGYTGDCIEVRRSSDNTTQNIGFVNDVLDTASLLSFVGAGNGFVRIWYNQNLSGINAIQTIDSNQPRIVNAGVIDLLNNLPTLTFSSNQWLDASVGILAQPNHYFITCFKNTGANNGGYLFDSTTGRLTTRNAQGDASWIFAGTTLNNSMILNIQALCSFLFSTTSISHINSILRASGNAGTQSLNGLRIGAGVDLGFPKLLGRVQEFILYNSNQSTNRTGIESNINSYYNIY